MPASRVLFRAVNDSIGGAPVERPVERPVQLSIVIPVFNEAGNIRPLMDELIAVLGAADAEAELIWVDDASDDGTGDELKSLLALHERVRVICLPRRSGQSLALWTGICLTRGDTIITLDGDGQNDPADIPRLLSALDSADMVVGYRARRRDPLAKRFFGRVANQVRNLLTRSQLPDSGCGLKAFKRNVLRAFIPFDGMHRFLPTLAEVAGFRVVSIAVRHRTRQQGTSKYGIRERLVGPLLDCLMLRRLKSRQFAEMNWRELERKRDDAVAVAREAADGDK